MRMILLMVAMVLPMKGENRMTEEQAGEFVELALAGLAKEYPNKISVVLKEKKDLKTPQEMFPVFYGHFDWHSSVHGHWTLVRLLRMYPEADWQEEVRGALGAKFSEEKLKKEAAYLEANPSFERMYGWAWALRLGVELRGLDDEDGKKWARWYGPVEEVIVKHAKGYLPKLDWPIRCGFHPESSFALGQLLDWARATGDVEFEKLLVAKASDFYLKDEAYPVRYEPSGNDFFSAGLNEADLMRRVLTVKDFRKWLGSFFPKGDLGNLEDPATVSDLTDGHLVHLAGLNLNRAWDLRGIASALEGVEKERFLRIAKEHEEAGLKQIFSGSYAGEHWLGSFATYLLTGVGEEG
ncbi:MAG: DUF2891 domain-containing protein [Verrucomicrobiaceae bacterium]